jgi:hypothetical protein
MPGVLAEMLITALNMVGFSWQSGPVSTELEMVRWQGSPANAIVWVDVCSHIQAVKTKEAG